MAVSDLSADFYLETVRLVFQEYALPLGKLTLRGRHDRPDGDPPHRAPDDRRRARRHLRDRPDPRRARPARGLRPYLRTHYVQPNVGHYGVFSGRRWQQHIYPVVRNVIQVSQ